MFVLNLKKLLDTLCPVFQIGYILEQAEPNPIERELILEKVILISHKIEPMVIGSLIYVWYEGRVLKMRILRK